ncbi:IS66 family insertion sequence element accessory protein TnpB [Sinorhizobium sp. 22678]|uniref:IS66 family insertion sequence element accessory protein TnpB n=1 Tax=Sinorhizobium sp. 22678 TaxID=3453955 RepID=UPI003F870BD4
MIPSNVKVFLASHPIDFRKGPDGLLSLVRDAGSDPFNGALYVFRAKRADRIKIVWWDGSGVCLYANDLHSYCISLSGSVEGFGVSGIFLMGGDAIDELVPSTALLLR